MQSIRSDNQQQCNIFFEENGTPDKQQWFELFIKIVNNIAPKWKTLGRLLGLTDAVISSTDKDMFQPVDKAFAMLEKWIYLTGSSATKEKLSSCLEQLNLTSVAVNVQEHFSVAGMNGKIVEFKQQWFALFIKIGNDLAADWKTLGRMLGLTDAEISSIDNEMFQPADKAFAMLENWINLKGNYATKDKLSECLDKLSLTSVAVIVQEHFSVAGMNAKIVEGKEETQPLIQFK